MFVSKLSQAFDPTQELTIPSSEVKGTSLIVPRDASRTRALFIEQIMTSGAELYFSPATDSLYAVTSKAIGAPFEEVISPELSGNVSIGGFSTKEKYVWGAAGLAIGALVAR